MPPLHPDQPAVYEIKIQGHLPADWLENLGVYQSETYLEDGALVSTLRGRFLDQSALHGLIEQIRDLGLAILVIQYLKNSGDL